MEEVKILLYIHHTRHPLYRIVMRDRKKERGMSADATSRELFFLVIKHTMAIALEALVCYLLLELLAHALEIIGALKTAGAISARPLQALLDHLDDLLVFVKPDLHYLFSSISEASFAFGT